MAEHEAETSADSERGRPQRDYRALRGKTVGFIAGLVRWIGLIFAVVLVLYVVLTIGEANPANGIASFIKDFADAVSIGFKDLFTPADMKLRVLVNYGVAAIFWLIVSSVIARLIRRLA